MNSLIQSDIFFFITSIAVVVFTILIVIAFYYLVQILKNFRDISDTLKNGVNNAKGHIEKINKKIEGNIIYQFLFGKKKVEKKKKVKSNL